MQAWLQDEEVRKLIGIRVQDLTPMSVQEIRIYVTSMLSSPIDRRAFEELTKDLERGVLIIFAARALALADLQVKGNMDVPRKGEVSALYDADSFRPFPADPPVEFGKREGNTNTQYSIVTARRGNDAWKKGGG